MNPRLKKHIRREYTDYLHYQMKLSRNQAKNAFEKVGCFKALKSLPLKSIAIIFYKTVRGD